MGNQASKRKTTSSGPVFPRVIDSIATKYILTQNFSDMKKLEDKDYCNDLTILTSDVIYDRLNNMEIEYLNQRTKQGVVVDELTKDKIIFLQKKYQNKLDIHNEVKKRRVCIGIAKFYIKVAHLFSAIVSTINPVYTYKNQFGEKQEYAFMDKMAIPEEVRKTAKMSKLGLCHRRINSMMIKELKQTVQAGGAEGDAEGNGEDREDGIKEEEKESDDINIKIDPLPTSMPEPEPAADHIVDISLMPPLDPTPNVGIAASMKPPVLTVPAPTEKMVEPAKSDDKSVVVSDNKVDDTREPDSKQESKSDAIPETKDKVDDDSKVVNTISKEDVERTTNNGYMDAATEDDNNDDEEDMSELSDFVPGIPSKTVVTGYQVKNNVCSLNKKTKLDVNGNQTIETKNLFDEPGMPELQDLYMDTFDYNTGKFVSMSDASKKQYKEDVKQFYMAFTGKKSVPSNIQKFSDIKLHDYHNMPLCTMDDSPLAKTYTVDIKDRLIKKYGEKLAIMTKAMNDRQNELIKVLDDVFVYRVDPDTKNMEITLHPDLTVNKLDKVVKKTRKIIVNLYIGCEKDFLSTLEAFEAIVEKQIKDNTERKIQDIKSQQERLLAEV
jgi:hypothetical protein